MDADCAYAAGAGASRCQNSLGTTLRKRASQPPRVAGENEGAHDFPHLGPRMEGHPHRPVHRAEEVQDVLHEIFQKHDRGNQRAQPGLPVPVAVLQIVE